MPDPGRWREQDRAAGPEAPLPAPYESPERQLLTAARAVLASWRLKARELWRRNREGDLPRPTLWPQALAAWFWPLLTLLALALLTGLLLLLGGGPLAAPAGDGAAGPGSGVPMTAAESREQRSADAGADSAAPPSGGETAGPLPSAPAGGGPTGQTGQEDQPEAGTPADLEGSGAGPAPAGAGGTVDDGTAELSETDPRQAGPGNDPERGTTDDRSGAASDSLLAEFQAGGEDPWIAGLAARPAEGLLALRLTAAWTDLPAERRRTLAAQWLERTRNLGYERLELRDPQQRLVGRSARVGSGMILLDPGFPSPR